MKILKVNKPSDYSSYIGVADRHPLICVIDYERVSPVPTTLNDYGVYGIILRGDDLVDLKYGCGSYDYKEGTLITVAPGQIGGAEDTGEKVDIRGWTLFFHPDLLHGTPLEHGISRYSFFDYRINEALHMTEEERDIIIGLMRSITGTNASKYIQRLVVQEGKNLLSAGHSISQTAYSLGFEYPQHFTRFFKREEGMTPTEYIRQKREKWRVAGLYPAGVRDDHRISRPCR